MGRKGDGVEVRERSIRLTFSFEGKPQRHTLMVDGQPVLPTPAGIKYARRVAAEIREKIRHGVFVLAEYFPASGNGPGPVTVGAQLDTWLAAQRLEDSTKAGYESAIRFWKSAPCDSQAGTLRLGDRALRVLKLSEVLTAIAARPDLSGKTINNYVSVLREAVELAVKDGTVEVNVVDGVPRAKWQRDPPDPFSLDEAERIIADARKHYPEQVANLIETWFFSGPRTGEIFGLRWPSVDLARDYFRVHEALVRGAQKDTTKTAVSRDVRLNSRAGAALRRQAKNTRITGEHVFLDPRYGTPWTEERAFRRSYWTPCLKRLGIRYRRPYNMRHTYATMMLMARRTPAWCAKQMGHSVEVFLRTYAKWIEGEQDDREISGLEDWLQAGSREESREESGEPMGATGRAS